MKSIIAISSVALLILAAPGEADAKGCIKGALVGGAVGHYTTHHGLLGAAAGCVIGRHEANKHDRDQARQHDDSPNTSPDNR